MSLSGATCKHGVDVNYDCAACEAEIPAGEADARQDGQEPDECAMSAQDMFLSRMRYAAAALLARPADRELTPDEMDLFVKGAMALASMFTEMDEKLSQGAAAPTAWQMDRNLQVDTEGIPSSQLHQDIKATMEHKVMQLVGAFEKLGGKTGARFSQAMGEVLVLAGRLTSESVRLAVSHRVTQTSSGAPELIVKDTQAKVEPVTRRGRAVDQEN